VPARKKIPERSGESDLDRRGMLQSAQHGAEAIPVEFLIAFTRALIRMLPSNDALWLAANHAKQVCPLTDEQRELLNHAIRAEVNQSVWPKGFM
jgi:hypothetical protein